ncbi:MAG TPA: hypothetical protein VGN23_12210 [Verrucomicrobiae bacterium]
METISELPAQAVYTATEKEREMIEEDISYHRSFPIRDTMSILGFCRFVHAAMIGMAMTPSILPFDHVEFYRRMVARLVAARELTPSALQQFDSVFLRINREEQLLAA